jgi:hypothetical protein
VADDHPTSVTDEHSVGVVASRNCHQHAIDPVGPGRDWSRAVQRDEDARRSVIPALEQPLSVAWLPSDGADARDGAGGSLPFLAYREVPTVPVAPRRAPGWREQESRSF